MFKIEPVLYINISPRCGIRINSVHDTSKTKGLATYFRFRMFHWMGWGGHQMCPSMFPFDMLNHILTYFYIYKKGPEKLLDGLKFRQVRVPVAKIQKHPSGWIF